MTASDDNLVLLQNKLGRPELPILLEKIGLQPAWLRQSERQSAYLAWPLELRAAVNRALFPNGLPGGDRPESPTPTFRHFCLDLNLVSVRFDSELCLPDELLYGVEFELSLQELGGVRFEYLQLLWDDLAPWADLIAVPQAAERARQTLRLVFAGLLDPLRENFVGYELDVLCEDSPEGLTPGCRVNELARPGTGLHLGDEIERLVNERRLQPMLRDAIISFGVAAHSS